MKKLFAFDKTLFWIMIALVVTGLFVFLSASFAIFDQTEKFRSVLFNHMVLGLGGGAVLFFIMLRIPYESLKKYSLILYILGLILLALVFIPGIGLEHGGARRWISIAGFSFQPVEFIKYAFVIYMAAWLSVAKKKIHDVATGLVPFGILIALIGILLLMQPDTDSFFIIAVVGTMMYFVVGAKWRDIFIMILIAIIGFGALVAVRPYLWSRIKVFIDPTHDSLGASYQVQQQLIAVGSGGLTGRGFGQSVQKFRYLPEPMSDSIFAVVGEELGFIGSLTIILLYLLFFLRGIWVAIRVPDMFGKLIIIGIISTIVFQSLFNIGSALAVFPMGGLPLLFMSQGGTALALVLGAMGLVLNISRKRV
jgi:cell division protein FtsW